MNATQTVGEVYEQLKERQSRCLDYKVQSKRLDFIQPCGLALPNDGFGSEAGQMNDRAVLQLSDRFGVPARWVFDSTDCPPALRELVFDWKFANAADRPMFLRAISDAEGDAMKFRAVLSDRYQPYDHVDLWEAVQAAVTQLPTEPKVILKGGVQDELRGYLLFDTIQFDADQPNGHRTQDGGGSGGLHPAVYFGNSEVGTGRVRIAGGLFRNYCSNGMVYGWKEEGALAVTHLWSQHNHIALAVHEGIANALKLSEEAALKMLAAMDKRIEPTKMESIFDKWAEKYGLLVSSKDAWAGIVRPEPTVFDVVNAATLVARDLKDGEQAEAVARMAGDMLADMTPEAG